MCGREEAARRIITRAFTVRGGERRVRGVVRGAFGQRSQPCTLMIPPTAFGWAPRSYSGRYQRGATLPAALVFAAGLARLGRWFEPPP